MSSLARRTKNLVKDIMIVLGAYLLISTLAFASYHIPSGSMVPTLEVGDRLVVNKFAYGYSRYSLPLHPPLFKGRVWAGEPQRGDVVVFHERSVRYPPGMFSRIWRQIHFSDGITYIKRVIGLPGDRIQMIDGRLYINGDVVSRRKLNDIQYEVIVRDDESGKSYPIQRTFTEYEEVLPGGVVHKIYEELDLGKQDNTREFLVPAGHYFMMGDNRDRSQDSRVPDGFIFVPAEKLIGRAEVISFSLARCNEAKGVDCILWVPFERFFNAL